MPDDFSSSDQYKKNQESAEQYISRFRKKTLGHYINGARTSTEGAKTFENISPISGKILNEVALGTAEDIDAASKACLLYTSPSPRDGLLSRMPSSA